MLVVVVVGCCSWCWYLIKQPLLVVVDVVGCRCWLLLQCLIKQPKQIVLSVVVLGVDVGVDWLLVLLFIGCCC